MNEYQKPYTFRAGTYAKSAEVNANFDTVKDYMDELREYSEGIEISSAPYNKANKLGDPDIAFYIADAVSGNQAVSKDQMDTAIADTKTELEDLITSPPDYSSYTAISANSTIPQNGLLIVKIAAGSVGYVELDGSRFEIPAQGMVTFPVKDGTEVGATSNVYYMRLFV